MNDKEKVAFLIGFLKGIIGSNKYCINVDVETIKFAIQYVSKSDIYDVMWVGSSGFGFGKFYHIFVRLSRKK